MPQSIVDELAHLQQHPISKYDFPHTFEPFAMESYQFILYGMKNDINFNNIASFGETEKAQHLFDNISKSTQLALKELPNHRTLITKIYQYGLANV